MILRLYSQWRLRGFNTEIEPSTLFNRNGTSYAFNVIITFLIPYTDMKHDLTLIDLPTLMPEDTVLDVLKFLVGAIVINVVVGGERTVSAFTCGRCNNSHAVGALCYHVEMAIADDTAEGTFVWFDGVMMKLHSLRASGLFRCCYATSLSTRVRVTAFNFTEHHKTFTITRIAEELGRAPVDDNGGGDDDDNDVPPGKPTPDEFGSGGAIGDSSKVVKKVCVG
ncbi:unnamed protein product [Brassica rapa]|uniref:Uncharacterized protein n=2 Tax=Brassica TaxID=3705 RepID=A0A8D9CSV4_BRACM|nr:unnamed protein product [Brassica napus]CAG7864157.1 unnamed protein product [Brassica rapa]